MNREDEDRLLQDYLDDRLSAEQRADFEARIDDDPELALRAESAREFGPALRAGDESLSPGFYTRARARFEEGARGKRRRWFRPLSWETAGLVTAVVLVAAVFLPGLIQQELPGEGMPERSDLRSVERNEFALEEADRAPRSAGEAAATPAEEREKKEGVPRAGDAADEESTWAPSPGPPAPAPALVESLAEPRAVDKTAGRDPAEARRPSQPAAREETRPDLAADPEAELRSVGYVGGKSRAAAAPVPETRALKQKRFLADRFEGELAVVSGIRVPLALAAAGTASVIRSEVDWRRLVARVGEERLAPLGSYDPGSWLVLIGAQAEPFDCSMVHILVTETAYRLVLPLSAPPLPEEAWSCAVRLDRDRPEIVLVPAGAPDE